MMYLHLFIDSLLLLMILLLYKEGKKNVGNTK